MTYDKVRVNHLYDNTHGKIERDSFLVAQVPRASREFDSREND